MKASRAVLDSILARGEEVYGLTTGVGAIKTARVTLGAGTGLANAAIRRAVPFTGAGQACDGGFDELDRWLGSDAAP